MIFMKMKRRMKMRSEFALKFTWVMLRHFIIAPLCRLLEVVIFLPPFLMHKTLLGLAYAWTIVTHAPYIIANIQEPDADEWDLRNFIWLTGILIIILCVITATVFR